ncbi:hypothetical protein [uncultured Rikenella sp.]|uniref:hypothetical protein n=1 Tax=uncultured Rikenella sp. TaxID=368003 RepID=UPI00272B07BC|nr:hypothetical protein [uncultured Rikenella sp.]
MKNIVIIDHEPLTVRKKEAWHIEKLQQAGFNVYFWDVSQYIHPGMTIVDTLDEPYVVCLDTYQTVESQLALTNIPQTIFIVEVPENWNTRLLFRLLSASNCYTIRIELYASIYMDNSSIRGWRKLMTAPWVLYEMKLRELWSGFRYRIYKQKHGIKAYNLQISSHNTPATDVLINHPDWENYKSDIAIHSEPLFSEPYIVFLDEYYPLHPDLHFFTKERVGDVQRYRQSIIAFFDNYEKLHAVKIVIAAHPKADYQPGDFGNRPIIKYQTNALIRHAHGVFLHCSAAVAYAIMLDRPIAFFTNNEYNRTATRVYFQTKMADNFQYPVWNIDQDPLEKIKPMKTIPTVREQYIYGNLTSPDIENRRTADILIETFKTL